MENLRIRWIVPIKPNDKNLIIYGINEEFFSNIDECTLKENL